MVDGSSVSSLQVVSTVNGGGSLRFEFWLGGFLGFQYGFVNFFWLSFGWLWSGLVRFVV